MRGYLQCSVNELLRTAGEVGIMNSVCSPAAEENPAGRNETSLSLWANIKDET